MVGSSKNSCLFIINGLGLGNSTRCDAIIKQLLKTKVEIHILTCDNGLKYFENNKEIASLNAMESFHYGSKGGKLSILQTILSLPVYYSIYKRKSFQLTRLLEKIKPSIAVTDSEYAIYPLKKKKIPIIGINNSDVVVTEYLRRKNLPKSIRGQFWLVELFDYVYHLLVCDYVISPSINPLPTRHSKFFRVGLIVRQEIFDTVNKMHLEPFDKERAIKIVIMLSGSEFASKINFDFYQLPYEVEIVGRSGPNREKVLFHGRLWNNIDTLAKADILVVNGGFSAVSEAFVLGKYTLVIPVPGHAEQYINSILLKEAGLGDCATQDNVIEKLKDLSESFIINYLNKSKPNQNCNGAKEAAQKILTIMNEK
jgi:uncharacterized protein (TIGR00661 family)